MHDTFLIYGANGYTGELIAEEAKRRGHTPLLAGRNRQAVEALGARLGLPTRIVGLDDGAALVDALKDVACVIHSAGPFSRTVEPMARACLKSGKHYLDITGEIGVFESLHAQDEAAKQAGVMLLPGVGFDVVPSDCLAAHLARRLPDAQQLTLAFINSGKPSRGTATTMIENFHRGGAIRKDGHLTPVPAAYKTRTFDFGRGPRKALTIPWGDVSTAYYSTGIPDIEVYLASPWALRAASHASRYLGGLLASAPVQRLLLNAVRNGQSGPTPEERARSSAVLLGEAVRATGQKVVTRLSCPEGYTLTARTAVLAAERVLKGEARPGFLTPSLAFGPDFILEAGNDVVRMDLA